MEELTLITEEKEYEPGYSGAGEGVMTKEQIRERIEELEAKVYFEEKLSDEEERELAELIRKIESNPTEPLHEPTPGFSTFHSLMLHAVAEMEGGGGIVVDEEVAKATPCRCVEYKPGKYLCWSRGIVGALTDVQEGLYCNPREMIERPGTIERMTKWQECVTKSREALPPTNGATRLEMYLSSMSKCLKEAGIKA